MSNNPEDTNILVDESNVFGDMWDDDLHFLDYFDNDCDLVNTEVEPPSNEEVGVSLGDDSYSSLPDQVFGYDIDGPFNGRRSKNPIEGNLHHDLKERFILAIRGLEGTKMYIYGTDNQKWTTEMKQTFLNNHGALDVLILNGFYMVFKGITHNDRVRFKQRNIVEACLQEWFRENNGRVLVFDESWTSADEFRGRLGDGANVQKLDEPLLHMLDGITPLQIVEKAFEADSAVCTIC